MRRPLALLVPTLLVLLLVAQASALGQGSDASLIDLAVDRSLLLRDDPEPVEVTLTLSVPAEVRLRVTDFDGRTVTELFTGTREAGAITKSWRGRDDDSQLLREGPYRIIATASAAGRTERDAAWVTLADRPIYPARPGSITVAVDPGHGGRLSGAVARDGTREADLNLDIGLRLARMLQGAGVEVAITRTTDAFVNEPAEERTGDGIIDETDELAARTDVANEARADLFISVHNNIAVNRSVGGPSTFFYDERPFSDRSSRLARIIQEEMVAALDSIDGPNREPHDHGALIYPYYVLRGFDPPRLRRPTQMPGVLSEGMFLSNERELRLLKRPAVRAAMAVAYYEAIAKYLARRETHVGYALVEGPLEPLVAGDTAIYRVTVRNQGNEEMRGWDIVVGSRPRRERYEGRARTGDQVGEARVPRLKPGESAVIKIEVSAPAPGEWMLLFDARDRNDRRASRSGSPMLQVPLTSLDPPRASPDPALPSASPEP